MYNTKQHSPWVHMITWKYAWMQPLQVYMHAEGYSFVLSPCTCSKWLSQFGMCTGRLNYIWYCRMWLGGLMRREKHCRQTLQNWMHNWQQWSWNTMILQLSCRRWKNFLYWQRMRWDLSHIVALQANFVVFGPSCVMVWPAAMVPHCVSVHTACVQLDLYE